MAKLFGSGITLTELTLRTTLSSSKVPKLADPLLPDAPPPATTGELHHEQVVTASKIHINRNRGEQLLIGESRIEGACIVFQHGKSTGHAERNATHWCDEVHRIIGDELKGPVGVADEVLAGIDQRFGVSGVPSMDENSSSDGRGASRSQPHRTRRRCWRVPG